MGEVKKIPILVLTGTQLEMLSFFEYKLTNIWTYILDENFSTPSILNYRSLKFILSQISPNISKFIEKCSNAQYLHHGVSFIEFSIFLNESVRSCRLY
jgi:hypothetical protein